MSNLVRWAYRVQFEGKGGASANLIIPAGTKYQTNRGKGKTLKLTFEIEVNKG